MRTPSAGTQPLQTLSKALAMAFQSASGAAIHPLCKAGVMDLDTLGATSGAVCVAREDTGRHNIGGRQMR